MKKIILLLSFLIFNFLFSDTILITGGNSGIGLSLVKLFLEKGDRVYATYRNEENSQEFLNIENSNLIKIKVDFLVNNDYSKIISEAMDNEPIDIIIHNAGFFPYQANKIPNLDQQECISSFIVHAIAPILITWELFPLLKLGSKKLVIWITSRRGSLSLISQEEDYEGRYGYTMSKVSSNMAGIQLSKDLSREIPGSKLFLIHPGRVSTKLTNNDGMPAEESARLISNFIENSKEKESGTFWDVATDEMIPW